MQRLLDIIPPGMTRIDLLAPPFSGHLHPILGIAKALATRYQVRIISTQAAMKSVQAAGLHAVILKGDFDTTLMSVANPQYAVKSDPVLLYRQFRRVVGLLKQFADELESVWREEGAPDLVIADFTLPVVGVVCQKMGIPWWSSLPSPCILETPQGVPAYCGGLKPPENIYDRFYHAMQRKKVRLFKSLIFWIFRQDIRRTGITRLYREDGSESAYSPTRILALSEKEFEFPCRWPESVTFIGPVLYTPPLVSVAPPFVEGKIHVLITLGTHLDWHKDDVAKAVAVLARRLPAWIFHFTEGHPAEAVTEQQGNFYRVPWVDYSRWLSRYNVVIHHGGAGIMWHCLQQNIPALVYPVDYDQFDHAARLEHSGKGIWLRGKITEIEKAKPLLETLLRRTGCSDRDKH